MCSTMDNGSLAALVTTAGAAVTALAERSAELVRSVSHDELSALLVDARRLQARLDAVVLDAVGEVDARGSYRDDAALSTGSWIRTHARINPGEATLMVRTARSLRRGQLPAVSEALRTGEVEIAHARAIAAALLDAPAGAAALVEAEVLDYAKDAEPRAVAAFMRQVRDTLDPDDADAAAMARYDRRGITMTSLVSGAMSISGTADDVSGSTIATALSAASPPVTGDQRTAAQRRLDALVDICRAWLASEHPRQGGLPARLLVTTDADGLAGTTAPGGTLSWIGPIAPATRDRLGCDADTTIVAIGHDGAAEVVKNRRRFFTRAQRAAMIARDGDTCPIPFCDRPVAWADAHHLISYTQDGHTTVANGAIPCAAHHVLVHEGHWTLHRLDDGRYQLQHPDGRTIGPEPGSPGHSRPPPDPPE